MTGHISGKGKKSRKRGCQVYVVLLLILPYLIIPSIVNAQLPTATILGVVKDSTAAVVPGAALTARNVGTGQSRTTVSGQDGSYRFAALPVGNYEVRLEHTGFQTEVRSGLVLTVDQEAVVNFTLKVGAVTETVDVTGEAPLVNTTSGSLGGLVDEQKVADLPLNGRNYLDLSLLQPGVVQHKNMTVGGSLTVGIWFSSNGAPLRSNNFMLDGAIITDFGGSNSAAADGSTLGIEGIQEYRVITNSFSAEYGMNMGSQLVMVSKSGTNRFHGDVFEYLRNSALDARNFFDYKSLASNRRLPEYHRNQFGASGGGPIRKNKTFFYAAYEGLRQRVGVTTVDNVIPAECHVTANNPCINGGAVAPVVQPLLTLFPAPNLPKNQFTYPFTQPTRDDYGQIRVDQSFSTSDTLFVRTTTNDTGETDALAYPQFATVRAYRSEFATLSENHIFTSGLLNTGRFSFSRTHFLTLSPSGISGPQFSLVPGKEIGGVSIGSISALGPAGTSPSNLRQNIFTWSDDLFYSRGRHSMKFGTLMNHYQVNMLVSTNGQGSVSFADVSSFLLGRPSTYTAVTPGSITTRTYHYNTYGFYGQDDIRVLSNLTLNIGLRYEFMTELHEVNGHGSALRDVQHDAAATIGPPFRNMSLLNFSPRFGFAWDVFGNGRTAIHGGFAELYDIGTFSASLNIGASGTPPFSSSSSVTNPSSLSLPLVFPPSAVGKSLRTLDYLMQQPHLLSYNLTAERQLPRRMSLTVAYAGSRGINILQTVDGNPTVPLILPNNQQFWPLNAPRTNPNWAGMEFKTAGGNSWYNSLQIGLTRQMSHGLQLQSSYTWAKIIDETQGQQGGDNAFSNIFGSDPSRREVDRGVADFDVTQNWHFNTIYQLPQLVAGRGALGTILNGWRLSGIVSLQTGYPFTPTLNTNRSRSVVNTGGGGIDRPDLLPGRNNGNIILGGPTHYFDGSAFALQPVGFLGNAGRNILRGPGLANLDFSLVKETPIRQLGESGKVEFRAEIFNILNRANFGMPNRTVFTGSQTTEAPLSTAGIITNTSTKSRQVQFALKILF